ncbi:MAG: hypothetical protein V2A78_00570 [bacterium]
MFEPLDFKEIKTESLYERKSKVSIADFGKPFNPGGTFTDFIGSLPEILAAGDLREIVRCLLLARRAGKPIIWALGAHVIKCGLSPVVIDLMRRGWISLIALNGAGSVHDAEIALAGKTSEDVPAALADSAFGMARETSEILNSAAGDGEKIGLGRSIGERLLAEKAPHSAFSILASGVELAIPITVHVAIGTDIVHIHPSASGAAIGAATYTDFKIFCSAVSLLGNGGVILNCGSAVILPVIFEKALSVTRNLGHDVRNFTGVNLDFLHQYRTNLNPIQRARDLDGRGFSLTGHHEIMIPLLAAALLEQESEVRRRNE